jgi:hypothetical protein
MSAECKFKMIIIEPIYKIMVKNFNVSSYIGFFESIVSIIIFTSCDV